MLLEIMALKKETVSPKVKYAPQGWEATTDGTNGASAGQNGAIPDARVDEARFCEWALQKLGHVALFAFSGLEASPFMIVAENGERTRGATLAIALQEMIACQEAGVRKPLYRPTWDERAGSEGVVGNPR